MSGETGTSAIGKREAIAKAAQSLAVTYKDSLYSLGGKSTSAMDCSYFVYLVFKEVFPEFGYLSSDAIAGSPTIFSKAKAPRVGDVIFFPKGQVPYEAKKGNKREFPNHVGIVIDAGNWIGRQTTKLGLVAMANPWWASRPCEFYSYLRLDSAPSASVAAKQRVQLA